MIYIYIYWEFFKIGLFAVGGGLATLPFLNRLVDVRPEWYTLEHLGNMIAVANSGPGPVGVNLSTTLGVTIGGILGGIIAVLGLITAPVIIVTIFSKVLGTAKDNKYLNGAMTGLRPAVTGLLIIALWSLIAVHFFPEGKVDFDLSDFTLNHFWSILILVTVNILLKKRKIPIVFYIILGGILGYVLKL